VTDDDKPAITVHTIAATTWPTSAELDSGFTLPSAFASLMRPMTDEEFAALEARREADRAAAADRYAAGIASLEAERNDDTAASVERLLRLARLHSPDDYGDCKGCYADEWSLPWPCDQWLIAVGEEEDE
jgi:hypothetical protein